MIETSDVTPFSRRRAAWEREIRLARTAQERTLRTKNLTGERAARGPHGSRRSSLPPTHRVLLWLALTDARELLARGCAELQLAQADGVGRDLHALVGADELQRLVERELVVRDEPDRVVGPGRAHVCLLLLAHGVDVEVLGTGVLAHHHPLVDVLAGADEQLPALLELHQREVARLTGAVGHEAAGGTGLDLALPGLVALEHRVQDARAARLGEELGAKADEAAGR